MKKHGIPSLEKRTGEVLRKQCVWSNVQSKQVNKFPLILSNPRPEERLRESS